MVILIGINDFMLTCLLFIICLSMLQLTMIQKHLDFVLKDHEAFYYYVKNGKVINEKRYQADGRCLYNIQTKKKICSEGKRIFYA